MTKAASRILSSHQVVDYTRSQPVLHCCEFKSSSLIAGFKTLVSDVFKSGWSNFSAINLCLLANFPRFSFS